MRLDLAVIDDILSVSEDEWLSGEDSDDCFYRFHTKSCTCATYGV